MRLYLRPGAPQRLREKQSSHSGNPENYLVFPAIPFKQNNKFVNYLAKTYVMISGAHAIIYTKNAEADKAFFRDVLKLPNVDVGRGWLIFGLPPSELAMHPADERSYHELYLMCDDIELFISQMTFLKVECSAASDQGWGIVSELTLPGGGKLGVYQPRHARPQSMLPGAANKKSTSKKPAAKKAGRSATSKPVVSKRTVTKKRAAPKKAAGKSNAKKSAPAATKKRTVASKSKKAKGRK